MEIVLPLREFHSANTTPFTTSPPKSFDFYHHDPAAAGHAAGDSAAGDYDDEDFDFDFNFSCQLVKGELPELTSADELFEKGKILPLKFPLPHRSPAAGSQLAGKNSDLFSGSMDREGRGRIRAPSVLSSRSRKGSRSLSPLRDSGESDRFPAPLNENTPCSCKIAGAAAGDGGRKWCFKDLLLFRSASEGRATGSAGKDRLRKYTAACAVQKVKREGAGDDWRGSSFRSVDGGNYAGRERARGLAPLHAAHYTTARAAAEEMRRRTALPFKEGFFSFLPFRRK